MDILIIIYIVIGLLGIKNVYWIGRSDIFDSLYELLMEWQWHLYDSMSLEIPALILNLLAYVVVFLKWIYPIFFLYLAYSRHESNKKKQKQAKRDYINNINNSMNELIPLNYSEMAKKQEIYTFEDAISYHLKTVFTEENDKKFGKDSELNSNAWSLRKLQLQKNLIALERYAELRNLMNLSFRHLMNGRFNECNMNLRKAVEWLALTKFDAKNMFFEGDYATSPMKIVDLAYPVDTSYDHFYESYKNPTYKPHKFHPEGHYLGAEFDYFDSEYGWSYYNRDFLYIYSMKDICLDGGDASHGFSNDPEQVATFASCAKNLKAMECIIEWFFEDAQISKHFANMQIDPKKYYGVIDELLADKCYDDVAVNIRKTLEILVRKYFYKFKIRCLHGHPKSLIGYIDVLYDLKLISEESKQRMHKIRTDASDSAHPESLGIKKESVLVFYEYIKKEIEIFENL